MSKISSIDNYIYNAKNGLLNTSVSNTVSKPSKPVNIISPEHSKTKQKNNKISFAASAAITAIIIGGLIYKDKIDASKIIEEIEEENINEIFVNTRINPPIIKTLAEHIKFKDAKTLDEAINFGINNLGIKEYKGFKEENLNVINWTNESIVNVSNKLKGVLCTPDIIELTTLAEKDNGKTTIASANCITNLITINKKYIDKIEQEFVSINNEYLNMDFNEYKKSEIYMKNKVSKNFKHYFNHVYAWNIFSDNNSEFNMIYHEMGHLQHGNNVTELVYINLGKADEISDDLSTEYTDELRKLFESNIHLAKQVSDYATKSPLEFVAEVFTKLCDDYELSPEILDLYKKLGGVMI